MGGSNVFSLGAGGEMAEVGLLPFARTALQVATAVLTPYRSRGDRKGAGLTAVKSDK